MFIKVDLNCDMGEGLDTDAAIFPYISSSNIACGAHAGDAGTMRRTIGLALKHGVAIGAHPGYPDRENFGRIDILGGKGSHPFGLDELADSLTEQIDQIRRIAAEMGAVLKHVKPHGALYNRAAKDRVVSEVICKVIKAIDPALLLYGLSGGMTGIVAQEQGLDFVREVFADRTYRPDGSLTPRTEPGALIEDPQLAVEQACRLVSEGRGETICLHGDGAHAVEYVRMIRGALDDEGIRVFAPRRFAD